MVKWWTENITEIRSHSIKAPILILVLGRESRLFRTIYSEVTKKYWWGMGQLRIDLSTTWRT